MLYKLTLMILQNEAKLCPYPTVASHDPKFTSSFRLCTSELLLTASTISSPFQASSSLRKAVDALHYSYPMTVHMPMAFYPRISYVFDTPCPHSLAHVPHLLTGVSLTGTLLAMYELTFSAQLNRARQDQTHNT